MKRLLFLCLFTVSLFVSPLAFGKNIKLSNELELIEIDDHVFIHKSFTDSERYGRFSSNGMVFIKNKKALLIDTPMTVGATRDLVKGIKDSLDAEVTMFIGGHYHDDCIGGMAYLNEIGVITILSEMTVEFCKEQDLPLPKQTFKDEYSFLFEDVAVICYYPGAGHSKDNITVYFPQSKIMFGGCLIKSAGSRNLGNTDEAVLDEWAPTVERLQNRFPDAELIVPGHGAYGGRELLINTIKLANQHD